MVKASKKREICISKQAQPKKDISEVDTERRLVFVFVACGVYMHLTNVIFLNESEHCRLMGYSRVMRGRNLD